MIPLYLVFILNMVVSHEFVLDHRLSLGGMPVNIVEGSILLTFVYIILIPMRTAPLDRTKRNYLWPILTLWIIAAGAGTFLGLLAGTDVYMLVQTLKWTLKLPIGIACGYFAVRNIRNVRRTIKFVSFLSCIVCIMILIHITEKSEVYRITEAGGILRTMNYNYIASAIVAVFLVYSAAVNRRYFSRITALVILAMSVMAVVATLTRSTIIALGVGIISVIMAIPKAQRAHVWKVLLTSGTWVVIAVLVGGAGLQYVLGVDIIGKTMERFSGAESAKGSAIGRWVGAINELKVWLGTTIIFGQGFGAVRQGWQEEAIAGYRGHNGYTAILARLGLAGLAAMVYPMWVALRIGRRMVGRFNPDLRAAGALMIAGAVLVSVESVLTAGLVGERLALFFGLILGIGMKCYRFDIVDDYAGPIDRQLAWDGDA